MLIQYLYAFADTKTFDMLPWIWIRVWVIQLYDIDLRGKSDAIPVPDINV